MPRTIEFFFDFASPYTYLAATQIEAVAQRAGAELIWRPFLLGGVFKSVGNAPPAVLAPRGAYMLQDLGRWARFYGVPLRFPSTFPVNSLLAMRALQGMSRAERPAAAHRVFHAHWVEDRDISDPAVLTPLLGEAALARANDPEVKDRLRRTTEEAVTRGAFGAPTFFVGETMFFGNDRLQFVEQAASEAE